MAKEIGFTDKVGAAENVIKTAEAFHVIDEAGFAKANDLRNKVGAFAKELEAEYKAHPTVIEAKKIQKTKTALAHRLEDARRSIKKKMMAWEAEQEKKRQEEEARLQAEMEKQAEEKKLAEAAAAEEAGDKVGADEILNEPVAVPQVVLSKSVPKASGYVKRTVRRFSIVDASKIKRDFLRPDQVKIGQVVRAMGLPAQDAIGGIKVIEEQV